MNLTTFAARAPGYIRAGSSLEMVSIPGLGKSSVAEQVANSLNNEADDEFGFAVCFLGTMAPVDLMGFMVPTKDDAGTLRATYTKPVWMTTRSGKPMTAYKGGILFLDEWGQAEPDVKKAAADLLLNRRLGQHVLPPGWVVWAASNHSGGKNGVTRDFDFLVNRRKRIEIKPDLETLLRWMDKQDVHPVFKAFTADNAATVFGSAPDVQGPFCTPRSLMSAHKEMRAFAASPDGLAMDPDMIEDVAGWIGQGACTQLCAYVRLENDLATYAEVVADPEGAKLPQRPDAMMLMVYKLAQYLDNANSDQLVRYIKRMKKSFATTFVKAAVRRDKMIVNNKHVTSWMRENSDLIAALVAL